MRSHFPTESGLRQRFLGILFWLYMGVMFACCLMIRENSSYCNTRAPRGPRKPSAVFRSDVDIFHFRSVLSIWKPIR